MFARSAAAVAIAASIAVTGAGTAAASAPSVLPASAPAQSAPVGTVVMIIRHGEKPAGSASGIDAQGRPDDHSLTAVGWQRARGLVGLFGRGHARQGLVTPTRIYAAGVADGHEGARTRETVAPLAAALRLPVTTTYARGGETQLAARVAASGGSTLISWQHKGIPNLADAFPGVTPKPPNSWPDSRFDVVWTLTRTATGWRFAQVPELVLPQDHRTGV